MKPISKFGLCLSVLLILPFASAQIIPDIQPSRTECVAPCAVFFDATGSTGLADNDYVTAHFDWDFGDLGAGTWDRGRQNSDRTMPSKNKATGFLTTHVYDTAGIYTVNMNVKDNEGNPGVATPVIITVSDPEDVYNTPNGQTYYVSSSSGSDTNDGLSEATPFESFAKATSQIGANTRILFKKGDTWNFEMYAKRDFSITIEPGAQGPVLDSPSDPVGVAATVSPSQGFSTVGPTGGNFPGSLTYTITNVADHDIMWGARATHRVLSISNGGGYLEPGESTTTTITIEGSRTLDTTKFPPGSTNIETVKFFHAGIITNSQRLMIDTYGEGARPLITQEGPSSIFNLRNGRDIRVKGLEMIGPGAIHNIHHTVPQAGIWVQDGDHLFFQDIKMELWDAALHPLGGHSTIYESEFANTGYYPLSTGNSKEYTALMGSYFPSVEVNGKFFGPMRLLDSNKHYIAHNTFIHGGQLKSHAGHNVITDNIFKEFEYSRITFGTGSAEDPCDTTRDSRSYHLVERNVLDSVNPIYTGGTKGIHVECGGYVTIRNNIIKDIPYSIDIGHKDKLNGVVKIYNNLIYDGRDGPYATYGITMPGNYAPFDAKNNIVLVPYLDWEDGSHTVAILWPGYVEPGTNFDNNIWYLPSSDGSGTDKPGLFAMHGAYPNSKFYSSDPSVTVPTPVSGGTLYPLSEWQDVLGFDKSSYFEDPLLSNPAAGLYYPQEGSPTIDNGAIVPVFDDFDMKPRNDGAIDIGAFEYRVGGDCTQDSDCDDTNDCTGDICDSGSCNYKNYNLDGNDNIGLGDIIQIIAYWGGSNPTADLNGNGNVGLSDIILLIGVWGAYC